MNSDTNPSVLLIATALITGVLLLVLVCRPIDPNAELARTTREAVELARDTGSSAESAALWAGRFRLAAVALGVAVPLFVVLSIWRSAARSGLDPTEVIEAVERYRLHEHTDSPEELTASTAEGLPSETTDDPTE